MKRAKLPKMTGYYLDPLIRCINRLLAPEGLRLKRAGFYYIALDRIPQVNAP